MGNRQALGGQRNRAFAEELPRRCLQLAGVEPGDRVLDPFAGTGTTVVAGRKAGTHTIGIEIRPELEAQAQRRLTTPQQLRLDVDVTTASWPAERTGESGADAATAGAR